MIGAGMVGLTSAWLLLRQGHAVQLLDSNLQPDGGERAAFGSGSWAALGVLMAQIFQRSSGRGWRLRQRSLELWQQWIQLLETEGHVLPRRQGVLVLAKDPEDWQRQRQLVEQRQHMGIPLELWSMEKVQGLQPVVPSPCLGGLYSPNDGQIDPEPVMEALLASARLMGLQTSSKRAVALERRGAQWHVHCADGDSRSTDWVVLSAGVASGALVEPLGHTIPLEPVLGQAMELVLPARSPVTDNATDQELDGWGQWPGVVVCQSTNLVPRPPRSGRQRLWLGASLERAITADPRQLETLQQLQGQAPRWLREASVERCWQGLRPHPIDRPAPVLEQLEPGLLFASGHYRNGVLLAPATAEWVLAQVAGTTQARGLTCSP